MQIIEIEKIVNGVPGWLTNKEGNLLFQYARKCSGKGIIVEIGSWNGKSTIWLAKGSKAGNCVAIYAIDPHTGSVEHNKSRNVFTFEDFKRNIVKADVDNIITPIVKRSDEAAHDFNKPVEFIFIDGAHDYDSVKKDFDLWFPKVINGGIMAFHDSVGDIWPGPKRVVDSYLYKSGLFDSVGFKGSITYGKRRKTASKLVAFQNRWKLFYKNAYELAICKFYLETIKKVPKEARG